MRTQYFEARNINGLRKVVVEHIPTIDTSSLQGPGSRPGLSRFALLDGSAVNRIDEDRFEVVQSGEVLTRVDD